jgi:hypothetical protein
MVREPALDGSRFGLLNGSGRSPGLLREAGALKKGLLPSFVIRCVVRLGDYQAGSERLRALTGWQGGRKQRQNLRNRERNGLMAAMMSTLKQRTSKQL